MSKVTSNLQITIPRTLADRYGIRAGDEVRWEVREAGPLMLPERSARARPAPAERAARFREAVDRVRSLQADVRPASPRADRGWTRDDAHGESRARGR